MVLGLGLAVFLFSKFHFFVGRYYKPFIFCIVQIVSIVGADTKYRFPTDTIDTFCSSAEAHESGGLWPSRSGQQFSSYENLAVSNLHFLLCIQASQS
jgi:hypothetical protein